jgi:ABC-type nickel/cobalt efflux system permease component RcnA
MLELQRWLYAEAGVQLKSFANGIDPLTLLTGISIAALFGLVHAFMPGHGKTVLVSYFLGRPSKVVAGLGASIILVLTHVGSAVVLVLTGIIVIRGTIGGAGRAPEFETARPPLSSLWLAVILFATALIILWGNAAMAMTLNSPAFQQNDHIPSKYTCEGEVSS